ncbi:hypothetical protein [Marinibacterium profundimaris]|uniref:Uncharacterized protein n=1 Tax=Marinibacterium profundimaris TaxID=1679460 RepID=A0A225NAB3_9RHOB|nr:hypothetical protein [Marinibacterium profundimaris]OWU66790.1 hypothetical protein ATO3_27395 [Marinibacterium profundimaris]
MAKTAGLAKKGAPPAREVTSNVIEADPRRSEGKTRPLKVQVPESILSEFNGEANERFEHRNGSKSKLFLEMWEIYQKHK